MNNKLTIEEVFNFLEENYPMCEWKLVPTPWSKGKMISWVPEKRFIVQVTLDHYGMKDNHKQYIGIGVVDNRNKSGKGIPCNDFEIFSTNIKKIIIGYKPVLFEEVQLCLF